MRKFNSMAAAAMLVLAGCGGGGEPDANDASSQAQSASAVPVANAGPNQNVLLGTVVTLDGADSIANGDSLTYRWTLAKPPGSAAQLNSDTSPKPTFTADVVGSYLAKLVVNNGKSDSPEKSVTLTVTAAADNAAPVAHAGAAQNVTAGTVVTLDGSTSTDANGDQIRHSWTFAAKPAGSAAQFDLPGSAKPRFTADVAGTYTASLIVEDGKVSSSPATVNVTAAAASVNSTPVAHAGVAQNVLTGTLVTLDGSKSSDADKDQISFLWTLTSKPAGSTASLTSANSAKPTFVADVAGIYVAALVVNDGKAGSSPTTIAVTASATVTNATPVANAGVAQNVAAGTPVTLDGSNSSDANGDQISYLWTLTSKPAASTATLLLPTSAKPMFTADVGGTYVASLIVNDGKISSATTSTSVTATVVNAAPVANAGVEQQVSTGTPVLLDGSRSSDANNDPISFDWVISSKPAGSAAFLASPASARPSFTADLPGTYVASLAVYDGKIYSDKSTVSVTAAAANVPPVANAGVARNVIMGDPVTLDGSGSSDANGDPITYAWTLIGKPANSAAVLDDPASAKPQFLVDMPGTFVATLVVHDGKVNSSTATVAISASKTNSKPDADAGTAQNVFAGSLVTLDGSRSSDANGDQIVFNWILSSRPAGSASVLSSSTSAKPTFTADVEGTYVATLVVNDGRVDSVPVTVAVTSTIANVAPIAKVGANQNVVAGASITLDGLASSDANGDKLTYLWTLNKPAGSAASLSSATQANPAFTADVAGTYVAQLVVNDGKVNSTAASMSVTAAPANVAPVAHAGAAQNVPTGSVVTLDGSGSSDANGDLLSYNWTLSAKPAGSMAALTPSGSWAKPSLTADLVGTYVARLVVSDGQAKSDPVQVTIEAGTAVSGTLANSQTWSKDRSPYALTGPIIVPSGVTLTIDRGVRLWGNGMKIQVEGTLNIAGAAGDLVSLSNVDIVPAGKASSHHLINISYAAVSGGKLHASTPSITHGSFILTDSSISGLSTYIDLWAPAGVSVIERNSFSNSYGLSYLMDTTRAPTSLYIRNNSFSNWTGFAIQARNMYGSDSVAIRFNSMRPGASTTPALKLPTGSAGTLLDAAYNDWGVTTAADIDKLIFDVKDDKSVGSAIYMPFLPGPDLATPLAAANANRRALR